MVTTVLRFIILASFLLWAPGSFAEGVCGPEGRRPALQRTLDEYRNRTWDTELADIPEASRAMVRDRARAVFENPWRVPETSLWRRLFFNQHRANPLPYDRLMVPTQGTVGDTLKAILRDLPARETELRARIRSHLANREVSYQAYIEACVDSVLAFERRSRGGVRIDRANMMSKFLENEAGIVLPTYRNLGYRDFPPGVGPRLVQIVPRRTWADGEFMTPGEFVEHDFFHARIMNAFVRRVPPERLQQKANRVIRVVEVMRRADPKGAAIMEKELFNVYHEGYRGNLDLDLLLYGESITTRFLRADELSVYGRWRDLYDRMYGTTSQAH